MQKLLSLSEAATIAVVTLVILGLMLAWNPHASGIIASATAFILWLPQARAVWRHRGDPHALAAVSLATQVILLGNAAIWGFYAFQTQAFWVGAPGVVNAPLALVTIGLILRSRRISQKQDASGVTAQVE